MKPTVGLPTSGTGCAFSVDPDSPACGATASAHVASDSPAWGIIALAACADHAAIARAAGTPLAEHEYGEQCAAGTCWTWADLGLPDTGS